MDKGPGGIKNTAKASKDGQKPKPKRYMPDSVLKKMPNRNSERLPPNNRPESRPNQRPEPRPNPFEVIKRQKMAKRNHYGQKVL